MVGVVVKQCSVLRKNRKSCSLTTELLTWQHPTHHLMWVASNKTVLARLWKEEGH